MEKVKAFLVNSVEYIFTEYGIVVACLFIGFTFGFYFKKFFIERKYNKLVEDRFRDKDMMINDLKAVVFSKLISKVDEVDPLFFKRLKKFFKSSVSSISIKK